MLTIGRNATAQEYRLLPEMGWCSILPDGQAVPLADKPIASLRFLEAPLREIEVKLSVYVCSTPIVPPFDIIFDAVLEQGHEYWAELAIQWTEYALDNGQIWPTEQRAELLLIATLSRYSQNTRHRARRCIRRIDNLDGSDDG
ncbi:hypothetical protein ACNOYE_35450 [Nannocystaceae bacterium ST9]